MIHNKEKFCENVSKAIKEKWKDPEYREKVSKAIKEGQNNPRTKEIWSLQRTGKTPANKGKKMTKEQCLKVSQRTKEAMSKLSPEKKELMREKKSAAFKNRIWVNNGIINKFIKKDCLNTLDSSWKIGKLKNNKQLFLIFNINC